MSSFQEAAASRIECPDTASLAAPRPSDAVLAVYLSLPPVEWRGRYILNDVEIVFADPARARALFAEATEVADAELDPAGVIRLLEESIRLDYAAAVDDGESLLKRSEVCLAIGRDEPDRSRRLFDIGLVLNHLRLWREAATAYHAAAHLDPLFVWPLNNLAWMAATATEPRARHGLFAVSIAEDACTQSGWGCGSMLGTLAAAYARAGDFRRAIAWQRICLHLATPKERAGEAERLRAFEARRAYIDDKCRLAAEVPAEELPQLQAALAQIDVQELLRETQDLIGSARASVH